ncbi:MAG TPA: GNAT family N-acetyltransferase, partial [Solirubrobacteraceae bacterium]|nr:GNAT family N-acetyltransferase [Solirubrobacteraceae bacterium]
MIPTLATERLTLRPFENEDLDAWAAIVGDPEVAEFIGGVRDRAEAWMRMAAYHGHWVLRGYGQWAVVETESSRFVGRCGLWNPEGWPELEVGWTLARDVWGRGYATEAGRAAVAWGRSAL